MARSNLRTFQFALGCLALLSASAAMAQANVPQRPPLALMGTVPIYWGESEGFEDLLTTPAHWARPLLERHFELVPLDFLTAEALAPHRQLLMAQPRGLAAEENVALDDWVRGGGFLLLFADPMMTGRSRYPLGDRRRPQDVALLSPILAHWGLELQFDEGQAAGLRFFQLEGAAMPVNLPGALAARGQGEDCEIPPEPTMAFCTIGAGAVLIFADAAVLDIAGPYPGAEEWLALLAGVMAGLNGENAGRTPAILTTESENHANLLIFGAAAEGLAGLNPP